MRVLRHPSELMLVKALELDSQVVQIVVAELLAAHLAHHVQHAVDQVQREEAAVTGGEGERRRGKDTRMPAAETLTE